MTTVLITCFKDDLHRDRLVVLSKTVIVQYHVAKSKMFLIYCAHVVCMTKLSVKLSKIPLWGLSRLALRVLTRASSEFVGSGRFLSLPFVVILATKARFSIASSLFTTAGSCLQELLFTIPNSLY